MTKAKMLRSFFIFFLLFCTEIILTNKARAQNCETVYEMIAELRQPPLGSYNLWDTVYGEIDQREVFKGLTNSVSSRDVVVVGEVSKNSGSAKSLMIMEVDRRGRPVWEKEHEVSGLEIIQTMISHGGNYVVLGTVERAKDKKAWLGFFDEKGNLFHERVITNKDAKLTATSVTLSNDKKSLIITAYAEPNNASMPPSTMMYWVDYKSKRVTKDRLFAFGTENRVNRIKPVEYEDGYWITGYIRTEDGRMAGWAGRLNGDGGLVWQRQFSRGLGGRFFDVAEMQDGEYLALVGEAFAADDTRRRAGWVLVMESGGKDVAWQRYYRENHSIRAQSVMAQEDGQISVMLDAKNSPEEGEKDYVRLLTLNPRGIVLSNLTFHNAEGGGGYGLINGYNQERIFYGFTDVNFDVEREDQSNPGEYITEVTKSRQGWIIAADANETYNDPCRKDFSFIP